jgi:hypothetical protein
MRWEQVLKVVAQACAKQGTERHVLLVLPDASFHVKEPLSLEGLEEGGLLGFMVFGDDPELSRRSQATRLVFVAPAHVLRIVVHGEDAQPHAEGFGFLS